MTRKPTALETKVSRRLAKLKWTKAELAGRANMSPQSLGNLLRRTDPKVATLQRIASALGVRIGELI